MVSYVDTTGYMLKLGRGRPEQKNNLQRLASLREFKFNKPQISTQKSLTLINFNLKYQQGMS